MDTKKLTTYPISERENLVNTIQFCEKPKAGVSLWDFYNSLPAMGMSLDFHHLVDAAIEAHKAGKPVMVMMGGHVIKCGCSPAIIALMEAGVITSVAMNGAASIHDFEIAMIGATSEDVGTNVEDGKFGMWEETGRLMNLALVRIGDTLGMGKALGSYIGNKFFKWRQYSILLQAYNLEMPITVHVAIGTDIIHQHPSANGAAIGNNAMIDFHKFVDLVCKLEKGSVILNFGSAVIMPEVFLKAVAMARNMGYPVENFTAGNFDMIDHYRPRENILNRANRGHEGMGYHIAGRHEIMIPLFAHCILDKLEN